MADFYVEEVGKTYQFPYTDRPNSQIQRGFTMVVGGQITLAAQQVGDVIVLGSLPAAGRYMYGMASISATLGTSQISVGTRAAPTKFKPAGTLTATNTPLFFVSHAATLRDQVVNVDQEIIATVGNAALPGAGTLLLLLFYAQR